MKFELLSHAVGLAKEIHRAEIGSPRRRPPGRAPLGCAQRRGPGPVQSRPRRPPRSIAPFNSTPPCDLEWNHHVRTVSRMLALGPLASPTVLRLSDPLPEFSHCDGPIRALFLGVNLAHALGWCGSDYYRSLPAGKDMTRWI